MSDYINVSATTDPTVRRKRTLARRGIIIHTTEGTNSLLWLQGDSAKRGTPASSDFLIDRRGNIFQIIPPGEYSFHSGKARHELYQESDGSINQGFYGIELESSIAAGQRVTNAQYISLAWLCRVLVIQNLIPVYNIEGHGRVALPHGRKSDPSGFDWTIFTRELINPSPEWDNYILLEELP